MLNIKEEASELLIKVLIDSSMWQSLFKKKSTKYLNAILFASCVTFYLMTVAMDYGSKAHSRNNINVKHFILPNSAIT